MKEIKIDIPGGYEIDRENSTFECIKFKEKRDINTWEDLCNYHRPTTYAFYISSSGEIVSCCIIGKIDNSYMNIYLTGREALRARAESVISQLMPYYGGAITNKEWDNEHKIKYCIYRKDNSIDTRISNKEYYYLAFNTSENRARFLFHNEKLIREYLMLD